MYHDLYILSFFHVYVIPTSRQQAIHNPTPHSRIPGRGEIPAYPGRGTRYFHQLSKFYPSNNMLSSEIPIYKQVTMKRLGSPGDSSSCASPAIDASQSGTWAIDRQRAAGGATLFHTYDVFSAARNAIITSLLPRHNSYDVPSSQFTDDEFDCLLIGINGMI
ncbi:hypothetical protein EV356DRAFT_103433 [Viridothelium virens]|uniref:Uncharacterized protein n=1 Tax=Viridothelium virens TaxID=1048519 RepID=A0A6A6HN52_VIRVR|nr:hypothetical protein EV356DRAFT_103433 [Viridothelium virens]